MTREIGGLSRGVVWFYAFVMVLMRPAVAVGQVGAQYFSQSRSMVLAHPSGTLTDSASTFGAWSRTLTLGGPGDSNTVVGNFGMTPTAMTLTGDSTLWSGGNVTSPTPVTVQTTIGFNLFEEATFSLTCADGVGVYGSASFSLTGPSVNISGRTIAQTGVLLPGAYTLTYTFEHGTGLASAGSFGYALNFTAFNPSANAFTYQGKLEQNGQPVNGVYDISGQVFDSAVGGSPVVFGYTFSNIPVTNGLFSVDMDFGAEAFAAGENRWLEIAVRDASDPQAATVVLSPRVRIAPAPVAITAQTALHAGTADSADTANTAGFATSATTAAMANGIDLFSRGLIRGEAGASGNSPGLIFATPVNSPIAKAFVGMADSNNVGFFGYPGAGWALTMRIDTGNVGLGTLNPAARLDVGGAIKASSLSVGSGAVVAGSYSYPAPQTRYLWIPYTEFRMQSGETAVVGNYNYGVQGPALSSTALIAAIKLPEGARMEYARYYFRDNDLNGDLVTDILRFDPALPQYSTVLNAAPLDFFGPGPTQRLHAIPFSPVVENGNYMYFVRIYPVITQWGPTDSKAVQGVRIQYTVDRPD